MHIRTIARPKRGMQIAGIELELLASRRNLKFTPGLPQSWDDYVDRAKARYNGTSLPQ